MDPNQFIDEMDCDLEATLGDDYTSATTHAKLTMLRECFDVMLDEWMYQRSLSCHEKGLTLS